MFLTELLFLLSLGNATIKKMCFFRITTISYFQRSKANNWCTPQIISIFESYVTSAKQSSLVSHLPFLGLHTFHLLILKHDNTWSEGAEEMKWTRKGEFELFKKSPHISSLGFSCMCVYIHTHPFLHMYCILRKHVIQRQETFSRRYCFISLIFDGIIWFTLTPNYYSFSSFLWMCSQVHANLSSHFSKQFSGTFCPRQASPTTLHPCVQSQLPKLSFGE